MKHQILSLAAQHPIAGFELTLQHTIVDQLIAEGLLRDYADIALQDGSRNPLPRHLRLYGITSKGREVLREQEQSDA